MIELGKYEWLLHEPGPRMVIEALKLYGIKETPGDDDNPEILSWAEQLGLSRVYSADEVPWCGLFMAIVAVRADKTPPDNPLWARNWLSFGYKVELAALGDVLVFRRGKGGHVTLYIGEDELCYHCLGGNQADKVDIARFAKGRLLGIRRPAYHTQPDNIRKIILSPLGSVA